MKIQELKAFSFKLSSGDDCVLVQDGREWNGMLNLCCIAPRTLKDERMVVVPEGSALLRGFHLLVGDSFSDYVVVMTTSRIRASLEEIGAIPKREKAEGAAA